MAIPISYNLRNLWTRRLTTVLTVSGMALVVFVFAAILMLANGLRKTLVETGSQDNVVILRKGAGTEVVSGGLAPVGQQVTHGGWSQWLLRSLRISSRGVVNLPVTSCTIQSRHRPSGTSFSVLHATTQSAQPTQRRVSITMPKRATVRPPIPGRRGGRVRAPAPRDS